MKLPLSLTFRAFLAAVLSLAPLMACDDHDHGAEDHNHAGTAGHDHAGAAGHDHAGAAGQGGEAGHDHGGAAGHDHGGAAGHDHGGEGGHAEGPDHLACESLTTTAKPLVAASDLAKAADAKLTSGEAVQIQRSATGASYVSFVNLTDHANWHLYLKEAGILVGLHNDGVAEELPGSSAAEECGAELPVAHLLHLHEPGVYSLELAPGSPEVWAFLAEGEAGH
jgi:hypothetical protein